MTSSTGHPWQPRRRPGRQVLLEELLVLDAVRPPDPGHRAVRRGAAAAPRRRARSSRAPRPWSSRWRGTSPCSRLVSRSRRPATSTRVTCGSSRHPRPPAAPRGSGRAAPRGRSAAAAGARSVSSRVRTSTTTRGSTHVVAVGVEAGHVVDERASPPARPRAAAGAAPPPPNRPGPSRPGRRSASRRRRRGGRRAPHRAGPPTTPPSRPRAASPRRRRSRCARWATLRQSGDRRPGRYVALRRLLTTPSSPCSAVTRSSTSPSSCTWGHLPGPAVQLEPLEERPAGATRAGR